MLHNNLLQVDFESNVLEEIHHSKNVNENFGQAILLNLVIVIDIAIIYKK